MHKRLQAVLRFVKQEIVLYTYFSIKNAIIRRKSPKVEVMTIEKTLNDIIVNKFSVSRYGDGEFRWMVGLKQKSFQEDSEEMKQRLREIIISREPNHIVCLSDAFGSLKKYKRFSKRYWMEFMVYYRRQWIGLLDLKKTYYNTNMTRLYMDYKDKRQCGQRFELIKKLWENRNLVIVEGSQTRLGVGNDLFLGAQTIKRILAPTTNAYNKYKSIFSRVCEVEKDSLILLALGPTATILAYDLCKEGYQAIDVGHVDVEYEWFLMGAKTKVPITNKYVNEAAKFGGTDVKELYDETYKSQIIGRII
jgi:glycosyltransferase family protein